MIRIYIGPSASGKDTCLKKDVGSKKFLPVVSYTTRPKREGEKNGVDYWFISRDEFTALEMTGGIFESRKYDTLVGGMKDTWLYGSPVLKDPDKTDYVCVLDIQGAKKYLGYYGKELVDIIFIDTPEDIRKKRAMKRGSFDETEWNRRLADDREKFSPEALRSLVALGAGVRFLDNSVEL